MRALSDVHQIFTAASGKIQNITSEFATWRPRLADRGCQVARKTRVPIWKVDLI